MERLDKEEERISERKIPREGIKYKFLSERYLKRYLRTDRVLKNEAKDLLHCLLAKDFLFSKETHLIVTLFFFFYFFF